MPRRASLAVAILIITTACGDAASPGRSAGYDFDLQQTGLVFRWDRDRLPVRYWVAGDAGVVAEFVRNGLRAWERQFLYGEYRGVVVTDSAQADVIVRVAPSPPPPGSATDAPAVIDACDGRTSFELDADDALTGPFQVRVTWDARYADGDIVNCLERATIHEIGHTLGLFAHSASELDLMYPAPRVRSPSPADRVTAEILYHTAPTIRAPAGN